MLIGRNAVWSAAIGMALTLLSVSDSSAQDVKLAPLKVAVYPGSLFSLTEFVGLARDVYRKHGLDVTLVPVPSGPEQIAAVASGSVDLAGNTAGNMLLANEQGQDLVVVVGNYNRAPYTWLKQPEFPSPRQKDGYPDRFKDFKGARIGVSVRGSEVELYTRVMLKDAGLNPDKDVTWVAVGFGQPALAAFEAKQVDILVTIDPVQSILLGKGEASAIVDQRTESIGPPWFRTYAQARISTRSSADQHADAFKRYIEAQKEIISFIRAPENIDVIAAIFTKNGGLPLSLSKSVLQANGSAFGAMFSCQAYANVLAYLQLSGQFSDKQAKRAPTCEKFVAAQSASIVEK